MSPSARLAVRMTVMGLLGVVVMALTVRSSMAGAPDGLVMLEDFRARDVDGFPKGWKGETGGDARARHTYSVRSEHGLAFLAANKADRRVKKKIAWDPRATPIVTWRWRLKTAPAGTDLVAAVFVSLDTDLLVIPVSTKYVWSVTKAKGTTTEGGLFGASEIVVRSGLQPVDEWVEERVNAYDDFKRIHKHEPADKAWGISLLGGPGVEVDFGPIAVSAP